ncbi:MAG: bacillithiol system redox-active protein YtxJ [Lewinella sp.]|jgi:bacillithiol system protein YtxJ|uniref:bacillithiol system redox-active protein YtxJ n=1 Tax=Lewinella sp. TaxID=2004506 RepID=UPI003D6BFFCC
MIKWNALTSVVEVNDLVVQSHQQACLIFKHSTRCSISSFAKSRLENDWNLSEKDIQPFYLDLIDNRAVSNYVADHFGIDHESPQVLLIKNGICVYDTSHLDISVNGIQEELAAA